ncbi:MAG TPA: DUF2911 domain-containing protein, partial [Ignavibacteriaceae bacterium]|nr:DUF2911 domain-containing protein [Ignavibacteriaceae bacterium]
KASPEGWDVVIRKYFESTMIRNFSAESFTALTLLLTLLFADGNYAQDKKIRVSPKAGVSQTVGLTDISISYSRPGVKGRTIWGELVPYGKVWRAGADEATKITFSTDVLIEGKKLAAGSYSFFVIPNKNEWTVIFNKVSDQWGAFEYNESQDAIRFKVKPQTIDFQEWLTYSFYKTSETSALISLVWEKMKIIFKVEGSKK